MNKIRFGLMAAGAAIALAGPAAARDTIKIVGSSTVFPFATAVAEAFGNKTTFPTPVIESTGSGGGLKLFCAGVGADHPDIANSSRRIKQKEIDLCAGNGVTDIVEIVVGYDGIVMANARGAAQFDLTLEQVYTALAAGAGEPAMWTDIDPALPLQKIEVLGPPPTSGTRDAFEELAMEVGAEHAGAEFEAVREDGVYVEAGENDNLIVSKLEANPDALGVFGFSFLDQNADALQGAMIDGVEPTFDNIASGDYPLSRSLYFYVKKAHVGVIPGLAEYVAEFVSDSATGDEGYAVDKGLIPLTAAERETRMKSVELMTPMAGL